MSDVRALNGRDHLIGGALCLGYLLLLLGTESDLAMSRDESFYVHAAKNAANWISQIFADPEVTPEALFKGAAAFRKTGEEHKALQLERQLHKNYPEFKGAHSLKR